MRLGAGRAEAERLGQKRRMPKHPHAVDITLWRGRSSDMDSASLDRTGAGVSKATPVGGETLEENPPCE